MEAYVTAVRQGDVDRVLLLAAAAVELLRVHPLLGDHATSLGYVDSLLKLLASRLPPTPGGAFAPAAPSPLHASQRHFNNAVISKAARRHDVLEKAACG